MIARRRFFSPPSEFRSWDGWVDWERFVHHAAIWNGTSGPTFGTLPRSGRRWAWWVR